MKKVIYLSLVFGLLVIQKSIAQSPVGFPTGIIVGTPSIGLTLPAGYTMAVGGGVITEKVRVATTRTIFVRSFNFTQNNLITYYRPINLSPPQFYALK